ncbi:MAG: LytTR family DNA-binding domain-containing protein [Erythrobacter sp.]|uniref:LytTR family DNA-binding domain-containing protein n=1 Tax=Erythrobacter sp. TaxID=1042 RepID=UPI00326696E1
MTFAKWHKAAGISGVCHFTKREWAGTYGGMNSISGEVTSREKTLSSRAAFWRSTLTDLAIMTTIGLFLAVIGPFGSIELPISVRLVTWLTFSYLGYAIYSPMGFSVDRLHVALDLPVLPLWIGAAAVATVPMTIAVYFVQFMPNWPRMPALEEALTSYFYVFVIGGGITLLFNFIGPRANNGRTQMADAMDHDEASEFESATPGSTDESVTKAAAANPLIDALPPVLGSDVIALEMEDHYVRVHTALGSELVLMRLRDAMVHVADIEGRQVHRSWWVARLAVEDVRREGRNVRLVLPGDLEAPVSRAQVAELKAAGWL